MNTLHSDSDFSNDTPFGLDALPADERQLAITGLDEWQAERECREAEQQADDAAYDFSALRKTLREGLNQLAEITAEANRQQAAFQHEFDEYITESRMRNNRLSALIREAM